MAPGAALRYPVDLMIPAPPATLHGLAFDVGKPPRVEASLATLVPGEPLRLHRLTNLESFVTTVLEARDGGGAHRLVVDCPLGLATSQMEAHGFTSDWRGTVEWVASFTTPRDWRRAWRAVSRREPRRLTDRRTGVKLSPTNLRRFKKTWCGMRAILLPLLEESGVHVVPQLIAEREDFLARHRDEVWIGEGAEGTRSGPRDDGAASTGSPSGIEIEPALRQRLLADPAGLPARSFSLLEAARDLDSTDLRALLEEHPESASEGWIFGAPSP